MSGCYSCFANYLTLLNNGTFRSEAGDFVAAGGDGALPILQYAGVPATLYGFEFEGQTRLFQKLLTTGDTVDFGARADYVRGENRQTGEPLPRLSPLRVGGSLVYRAGPWGARMDVNWSERQTQVPANDTPPTDAYMTLGVSLTYKLKIAKAQTLLYLPGDN